jgi:[acyl-carrier-protein] S-malonyltransferase
MKDYAILLPGQGSQYIGMGKELYDNYSIVREIYDQANEILNFNIKDLCFNGDIKELTKTENTQPAILLAGVSAFKVFMEEVGEKPKFICGHSIGEITALTCSGAINLQDGIKIVKKRGELMGSAMPNKKGIMAAIIGVDIEKIEAVCKSINEENNYVGIANFNSYNQIVISGYEEPVNKAIAQLNEMNGKAIILNVNGAFHSPLMESVVDEFKEELDKYEFNDFDISVISNVDALPYTDKNEIKQKLANQIVKPVKWIQTMEYLKTNKIDCVVDLGPKKIVKNLADNSGLNMKSFAVEGEKDEAIDYLTRNNSDKSVKDFVHTIVTKCIAITVCTKNENWNDSEYEEGVIKPYRRMQEIQEKTEKENRKPNREESLEALNLLKKIFKTKKTPIEEQKERFKEIFEVTNTYEEFKDLNLLADKI